MNAVTSEANKHNDAMKGQMQIENGTRLFHDRKWGIDRVPPISPTRIRMGQMIHFFCSSAAVGILA